MYKKTQFNAKLFMRVKPYSDIFKIIRNKYVYVFAHLYLMVVVPQEFEMWATCMIDKAQKKYHFAYKTEYFKDNSMFEEFYIFNHTTQKKIFDQTFLFISTLYTRNEL